MTKLRIEKIETGNYLVAIYDMRYTIEKVELHNVGVSKNEFVWKIYDHGSEYLETFKTKKTCIEYIEFENGLRDIFCGDIRKSL